MSTVLVDSDGVIADWGREWDRQLSAVGPTARRIPRHSEQTTFNLHEGRTPEELEIIDMLMRQPGFYARLSLITGARDALNEMDAAGHDVRIVTSPWIPNPTCASDKLNWVAGRLGTYWADRTIITKDKTFVHGDYLIDDKPHVTGARRPVWEHVVFEQPYNLAVTQRRRITRWADWKDVIE